MTDEEVIKLLQSGELLNRVRGIISNAIGEFEQDAMQRKPRTPIENRKREFEFALKIIEEVNAERNRNAPSSYTSPLWPGPLGGDD